MPKDDGHYNKMAGRDMEFFAGGRDCIQFTVNVAIHRKVADSIGL